MDAFRAFDADRDGLLNCSELYGGYQQPFCNYSWQE